MGKERVSICYCGNAKVFPMILLSALSVADKTKSPVTVTMITMDFTELDKAFTPISERQCEILQNALGARNPQHRAVLVRADEQYRSRLQGGKNEKNYYTPYTLLRLLLPELGVPDKTLYLDADVMCLSDVAELYETDLSAYEFAAVRDHMGKHFYGRDYFNAGVMLFNLQKCRETGFFERATHLIMHKKMMLNDQDAFNKSATAKLLLPRRFNEQRAIHGDTVLKHFCRGIRWLPFFKVYNIKQTQRDKVHKQLKITEFDDIYRQYDEIAATESIEE